MAHGVIRIRLDPGSRLDCLLDHITTDLPAPEFFCMGPGDTVLVRTYFLLNLMKIHYAHALESSRTLHNLRDRVSQEVNGKREA